MREEASESCSLLTQNAAKLTDPTHGPPRVSPRDQSAAPKFS